MISQIDFEKLISLIETGFKELSERIKNIEDNLTERLDKLEGKHIIENAKKEIAIFKEKNFCSICEKKLLECNCIKPKFLRYSTETTFEQYQKNK